MKGHHPGKLRDTLHLLNVFPEEVWIFVGARMGSSDLENLCNSSLYFHDLFLEKRVMFLFRHIVEILSKWEHDQLTAKQKAMNLQPYSRKNIFLPYLTCRLVCKSWRNQIDNFYQFHPLHFDTPHHQKFPEVFNRIDVKSTYPASTSPQTKLDDFIDHFEVTHKNTNDGSFRNPFISRSVTFGDEDNWHYRSRGEQRTNAARYWYAIDQLLARYGNHIWYCNISMENMMDMMYVKNLSGWLTLMPNLKGLRVYYRQKFASLQMGTDLVYVAPGTPEEMKLWEKEHSQYPFPKLEHLQFLKLVGLPTSTFNELVCKNNHVSKLEMDPEIWQSLDNEIYRGYDIFSVPLLNLSNLTLKLTSNDDVVRLETCAKNWKLQTLDIGYCDNLKIDENWQKIFHILTMNWKNTLEGLTLHMQVPSVSLPSIITDPFEEGDDTQITPDLDLGLINDILTICKSYQSLTLNLPRIQRLKLVIRHWVPLDFILPFKSSLEYLHIVVAARNPKGENRRLIQLYREQSTKTEEIQFSGCENGMWLDSNLWLIFEKLKEFRVEVAICKCPTCTNKPCRYKTYFYTRQQWKDYILKSGQSTKQNGTD